MVIGNENIKEENGVTIEEIQQVLADARTADINLRNKLWIEENKNFSLEILTLSEHFSDLLKTND